jgi:hypothetical protein
VTGVPTAGVAWIQQVNGGCKVQPCQSSDTELVRVLANYGDVGVFAYLERPSEVRG